MEPRKKWRTPIQVFSYRYLLIVPILLAILTAIFLFVHSDVNVALLYSQCHAHSRIPALSRIPLLGTPSCFMISFFQAAIASVRSFATMAAILSFIGGLLTLSTLESARVCNAPNVLIAYPTGPWLVFNLIGGAVVWQLVIIPAFFHREKAILEARRDAGEHAFEGVDLRHPDFGKGMRHLSVDAELVAIPVSVAWGFILPSILMLIYDSPLLIGIWLFFPVWVSLIRQATRFLVLKVQQHEHRSVHLETHRVSLALVYAVPVACSILSHGLFIWSLFQQDDRKEMTRATVKFIEIDVAFIALTVLYWLFVEAGWKVALVMVGSSIVLGPGAGICIGWIYRDAALHEGLTLLYEDETNGPSSEGGSWRVADEESPLLR